MERQYERQLEADFHLCKAPTRTMWIWRITTREIVMFNGRKRRPTHPGEILRADVVPALNITQGELAQRLGVSRRTVNEIMQEKRPVTVDTAHRLARALGTSPEVWLGLQQDVDLWDALQAKKGEYEQITPLRAA